MASQSCESVKFNIYGLSIVAFLTALVANYILTKDKNAFRATEVLGMQLKDYFCFEHWDTLQTSKCLVSQYVSPDGGQSKQEVKTYVKNDPSCTKLYQKAQKCKDEDFEASGGQTELTRACIWQMQQLFECEFPEDSELDHKLGAMDTTDKVSKTWSQECKTDRDYLIDCLQEQYVYNSTTNSN